MIRKINDKGHYVSEPLKNRFYNNVTIPNENGCMIWSGSKDSWGYGHFSETRNKKRICIKAHRYSYLIHNGEILSDRFVCHTCDNPACVSPLHLFLGTPKDNVDDCINKGRFSKPMRGELSPNTSMTDSDVKLIKERLKQGDAVLKIAKDYKVSRMCIYFIKNNKTWRHI